MEVREIAISATVVLVLLALFRAMVKAMVEVCTWVLVAVQP